MRLKDYSTCVLTAALGVAVASEIDPEHLQQPIVSQSCAPHSFTYPDIFGLEFLRLDATLVTNYSLAIPEGLYWSHHALTVSGLNFCKVGLDYTHPGYGDEIHVEVWLPAEGWNGRMQGSGGAGFQTGLVDTALAGAVNDGYAVVSTDGGHELNGFDPSSWALSSLGNVNWFLLQDFASLALSDAAGIGKAITKQFYRRAPAKSYWNGCSTGGRQGLMLAQRYPTAYDGILAAAPAINWAKFVVAEFWPQMVMYQADEYPFACELEAITAAAVEACDELDGVKDGIVSEPDLCRFNAHTMVGRKINCEGSGIKVRISQMAAKVAEVAWTGARRPDGSFLWYGLNHESPLMGGLSLANTACEGTSCKPAAFRLPGFWITSFLKRDPKFDLTKVTHDDLVQLMHQSHNQFRSILSTDDPDLGSFRDAGGKLITWHGLADQLIYPNGSRQYYEAVAELDPGVADFYRYFEAPGVWHCFGGPGPLPSGAFDTLVEWVEKGKAPDTLLADSIPDDQGLFYERNLCAYPKKSKYRGVGDVRRADSFECV